MNQVWKSNFEKGEAAYNSAQLRFMNAHNAFSEKLRNNDRVPVTQADHDEWLAAKQARDAASAEWTRVALEQRV